MTKVDKILCVVLVVLVSFLCFTLQKQKTEKAPELSYNQLIEMVQRKPTPISHIVLKTGDKCVQVFMSDNTDMKLVDVPDDLKPELIESLVNSKITVKVVTKGNGSI